MNRFILRRILHAIPILFGVTILSFLLMQMAPGDPVSIMALNPSASPEGIERIRRQLGLDQPPLTQYLYWLVGNDFVMIDVDGDGAGDTPGTRRGLLRGDLGVSLQQKRPVLELIVERIPATLQLTLTALIVSYTVGILVGVLSAVNHGRLFDQLARVLAVIASVIPNFWLALILIIIFSVNLGWLPLTGMRDITSSGFDLWETVSHMILPVFVLSVGSIAGLSRYMRTSTLEAISQDYIRTAQAKGLSSSQILWRHVMRNALLPVATFIGPSLSGLLSGAVIIETVFSWPGMGRLSVLAAGQRDYPLVMGFVVIGSLLYLVGLTISDLLYMWLDPRIRIR